MAETEKEMLMRKLKITSAEADELLAYDKKVEHNEKTEFDLTKEQEQETRKYRQADRNPTVYNWQKKRERKPNETKRELIDDIYSFLCENWLEIAKNADIVNAERQIDFEYQGKSYSLTLTEHRKPKS